ncbi:ABC transporter permease [Natronohydrobacter thiooxidans]|jgi:spermidine/putrescine transport system permease protein|uniref:ABC transporter permease n=1 Tax=Natronohydrobacter thiooxidans TaxID=87172 RepID=UPI0008FF2A59|nr:ABC transporter permease [Natronohydrobacter thiooxidans]
MAETSTPETRVWRDELRRRWALASPAMIVITLFSILPLMVMVVYSFLAPGLYGNVIWEFSLRGWAGVFTERDLFDDTLGIAWAHVTILGRSVALALATTALTLVFGLPTAWFIATRHPSTRAFWLFLITIPFWTNLLVRTIAIQEVIRADGTINRILLSMGVIDAPFAMMFTNGAVLLGMSYVFLPLMVLPVYAAIEKFDFRLAEAAYDLHASRLYCLRRVILPLMKPGIVAGSILVFIPALGAYVTPRLMGGGRAMMWGNLIDLQFGQGRNWPLGAALSVVLTLVVAGALVWYVRATAAKGGRDG